MDINVAIEKYVFLSSVFPGAAHLRQQLAALQQESEEEHQASRREVMTLRDQLQRAYQERDEARTEVQRLGETVEVATAAKVVLQSSPFTTWVLFFVFLMVTFHLPFSLWRQRYTSTLLVYDVHLCFHFHKMI